MKWLKGNKKLSCELAECFDSLESKRCYDNIFLSLKAIRQWEIETQNPVRICFGYLRLYDDSNLVIRHCFLEQEGEILDPTLTLQENGFNEQGYIIMQSFSIEEYLDALSEGLNTDLAHFLEVDERRFQQDLLRQGFVPIG